MADEPNLSIGDTGEWVTYLRQLLEGQGFGTGFTSDQFDETTRDAVSSAQQQYGLEATGVCDDDTWAALDAATAGSDSPDSGSQTGQDTTTASYDPQAWESFLDQNGPYWNGDDAAWDQFHTWFAYEAGQQNLADPAAGFLSYVESQPDKVAAFAAYGVAIASATGSGNDGDPGTSDAATSDAASSTPGTSDSATSDTETSQTYDVSAFPETKLGDSGEWVAYLDAMLTSKGF